MTRTSDTWITTKVKSWLLGSTDTEGLRVKVVTENGVVYLMGLATREEARARGCRQPRISPACSGWSSYLRSSDPVGLLDDLQRRDALLAEGVAAARRPAVRGSVDASSGSNTMPWPFSRA